MRIPNLFDNHRPIDRVKVVIHSSGASEVNILEILLSPKGKKDLNDMADLAIRLGLRRP